MCSVVYALDLYSCVYMNEVITVKKGTTCEGNISTEGWPITNLIK